MKVAKPLVVRTSRPPVVSLSNHESALPNDLWCGLILRQAQDERSKQPVEEHARNTRIGEQQ